MACVVQPPRSKQGDVYDHPGRASPSSPALGDLPPPSGYCQQASPRPGWPLARLPTCWPGGIGLVPRWPLTLSWLPCPAPRQRCALPARPPGLWQGDDAFIVWILYMYKYIPIGQILNVTTAKPFKDLLSYCTRWALHQALPCHFWECPPWCRFAQDCPYCHLVSFLFYSCFKI